MSRLAKRASSLPTGRITRRKGPALFRYGEKLGTSDVVFGEPEDAALLGVLPLESLGLALNPLSRELIPLPNMLFDVGGGLK